MNRLSEEIRANNAKLSEALSKLYPENLSQWHSELTSLALLTASLVARAQRLASERTFQIGEAPQARDVPFDRALVMLEGLNPKLFGVWTRLFENGARSYVEEPVCSCSHREHHYARLFGGYVEIYGCGRILDVGCGPYGMPAYLATRNPKLVWGLEPLPMSVEPGFTVLRGFNEFLPWEDGQFDTVVSGTSLDHVLSLEASLAEVRRVLRPNGRYLVWLASVPGSAPFNEDAEKFEPIDQFHLFHFDRVWIEPIFERYFNIADATVIPQPGFDHVFYCLEPRPQKPVAQWRSDDR
jgi:SAM-dependent methyltransferase